MIAWTVAGYRLTLVWRGFKGSTLRYRWGIGYLYRTRTPCAIDMGPVNFWWWKVKE